MPDFIIYERRALVVPASSKEEALALFRDFGEDAALDVRSLDSRSVGPFPNARDEVDGETAESVVDAPTAATIAREALDQFRPTLRQVLGGGASAQHDGAKLAEGFVSAVERTLVKEPS